MKRFDWLAAILAGALLSLVLAVIYLALYLAAIHIHPEPITLETLSAPMPESALLVREVARPAGVKLMPLGGRP